ncbi:hypothetical protein GH146_02390 [archaeon]|nr:hypothetical protein [archaeon]
MSVEMPRLRVHSALTVEHIEEREKEIDNIKEEIQCLSSTYQEKIETLDTRISNLEEQFKSIQSQIDANKAEVDDLRQEKEQKIQDLKKKHFIYFSQSKQETTTKKRLGRKGYQQLPDYVIPVIKLIKNGMSHTDAFKQQVKELGDVTYSTVSAECTRSLGISTDKFDRTRTLGFEELTASIFLLGLGAVMLRKKR